MTYYILDENNNIISICDDSYMGNKVTHERLVYPLHYYCKADSKHYYNFKFIENEIVENLETLQKRKIDDVKDEAQKLILDKFPYWYQNNIMADSTYAQNAIAGLLSITSDQVMLNITSKIQGDRSYYEAVLSDPTQIDISDLVGALPKATKATITKYYQSIIESIVAYRLIRMIRDWSNQKEIEINATTSISDLNKISLNYYNLMVNANNE